MNVIILAMNSGILLKFLGLAVSISACVFVWILYGDTVPLITANGDRNFYPKYPVNATSNQRLDAIRGCIIQQLIDKTPYWDLLHLIINQCSRKYLGANVEYLKFRTDKKYLPFVDSSHRPCVVVTIGVGNETIMEQGMREYYPQCEFYAADPIYEIGRVYENFGKLFTVAVDSHTQTKQLHIMGSNEQYEMRTVKAMSLGEFLKEKIRKKVIHFVSMDAEGSEYRLLPYLSSGGNFYSAFDSQNEMVTICQMMIELHGPLKDYEITTQKFEKMFLGFIASSPYVPLRAYSPGNHHRMLVFNAMDPECSRIFKFPLDLQISHDENYIISRHISKIN